MSIVYITSDWHLGHGSAYKFSGNFTSQEEREGNIIENYASTVNKRDLVWFLGDIAFTMEDLNRVRQLVGTKRLILGNHDTDRLSKNVDFSQIIRAFDSIHGFVKYNKSWLSHPPIHPNELRGKFNVHGHIHNESIDDPRYFNACLEPNNFSPVKYQDILRIMRSR